MKKTSSVLFFGFGQVALAYNCKNKNFNGFN